ncbi:MAG: leucine--tRNA ligase [Candidatus ainarchaeum sp.]|nr:leucine--tRNA ligase [Candidatus ainarchaeum sp.]
MYDFSSTEKKWQNIWNAKKIGSVSRDLNKKKYFIIWAYLTVSGFHHVGHMRGFSYADAISRYKRMQGYNVLLPAGGHASGNAAVAKAKKVCENHKETVDYYKEMGLTDEDLKKISTPEGFVDFFSKRYITDYRDYGFIGDWQRFTVTTNPDYNKFIEWQFKKLKEKELLIQKPYYATVCVECGPVAVDPSEMDLSKGGTAEKNEYTLIKLQYQEPNQYIVVATLRPETMFGQTNVWLDYNQTYVKIKVVDEIWIASKEFAEKIKYQKENTQILGQINGKELVGKYCLAPAINREIIILPSSFCDSNIGTGIVTSVPSDAPADWIGLYDLQRSPEDCKSFGLDYEVIKEIKPISIIQSKDFGKFPAIEICEKLNINSQKDIEKLEDAKKEVYKKGFHTGVMLENCGKFAGMKVEDAKNLMKEDLIKENHADIFYDLSEEVICRCGSKVLIKKVDDQWFIDYSNEKLTNDTIDHVKTMNILPETFKTNLPQILNWFDARACARQGTWLGTKLPFDQSYTIEPISDSTLYPIYYLISLYVNNGKINAEQLTEEFFDYVFLNKGESREVSQKTDIDFNLLEEIKKDVEYWYPLDINLGGKEHQTVHFPVFLMNHVGILPKKYHPQGIFVNWWVVAKSGKISKSKGGVKSIADEAKRYSVDAIRLFYANIANPFVDISFEEDDLKNYKQRIDKIYSFIEEIINDKQLIEKESEKIDDWLISQFNIRLEKIINSMDRIEFKNATDEIYFNFYNDLLWYRNRNGKNKKVLMNLIIEWIKTMGLFTPHLSEELNQMVGNKYIIAETEFPKVDVSKINLDLDKDEQTIEKTTSDIRNVIKMANLENPKKITLFISEKWIYNLFNELKEEIIIKENRNVKELMNKYLEKYPQNKPQVSKIITWAIKTPAILEDIKDQETEYLFYKEIKEFLEKNLEVDLEIILAEESVDPKSKQALPKKIGILIQ